MWLKSTSASIVLKRCVDYEMSLVLQFVVSLEKFITSLVQFIHTLMVIDLVILAFQPSDE